MRTITGRLGTSTSMPGSIQLGNLPFASDPLHKRISETLTFNQQINVSHKKEIFDLLNFRDNTDLDVLSNVVTNLHNRCVDDDLVLIQDITAVKGKVHHITIAQTLDVQQPCTLTDTAHKARTIYRGITQPLFLNQIVKDINGITYIKTIDQTLALSETITQTFRNVLYRIINQDFSIDQIVTSERRLLDHVINQTLIFNQTITKTFGGVQSGAVNHSLMLTDAANYEHIYGLDRLYTDTLNLNQIIISKRFIIIDHSDTLILSDTLSKAKQFNIRILDRFEMTDAIVGNSIFNYIFNDNLIFSNDRSLALNAHTIIKLPAIEFERIPKNVFPVTYMIGKNSNIYLPQPKQDNSEALNNVVNVNRSMTGVPYTYVKRSKSRTLTYSFSLNRLKAQELGTFYLKNAADPIRLVTFDNKRYIGFITSEPLSYSQSRTHVNDVELTFEGIPM